MPAVFNAANEVAVARFINGQIKFTQIFETVERVMHAHKVGGESQVRKPVSLGGEWVAEPALDVILQADQWARKEAERVV